MPTHIISVEGQPADPNTGNVPVPVTVYQLKTILTDVQIKALPTTPVEIVPAPGAGKIIVFEKALFYRPAWPAGYTLADGDQIVIEVGSTYFQVDAGFVYDVGNSIFSLDSLIGGSAIGFSQFANDVERMMPPSAIYGDAPVFLYSSGGGVPDAINQPLFLKAYADGNINWTGGNAANTLEVTVFYSIVDL